MSDYRTIMERLSDEIRVHGDFTDREPTPQTIPVPVATLDSLVNAAKKLKAEVDRMAGRGASVADKALTLRDLLKSGAITALVGGNYYGAPPGSGGDGGITFPPNDPDPRPWLDIPPAPENLSALGAFRNVILDWDLLNYQNHSHMEVWRHTANVIGSAVKIGQTTANMYSDASGTSGTTYYYWVRAVNLAGTTGPFNATAGTPATLARIDSPDYENLSILNAAIANLAVDDAKIANMVVDKLLAGNLDVGQYIRSTVYTPGFAGFQIHANGNAEFNNVVARGAIYADAGLIGGALIDPDGVESTNYVANTSGWRLDNTLGTLYANDVQLPVGTVTETNRDYSASSVISWPTAAGLWDPYPKSGPGIVGVDHVRNTGVLVIRADVTLNMQLSTAGVEAIRAKVGIGWKPTAASPDTDYVPIRISDVVVAAVKSSATARTSSVPVTLNYQFSVGELTQGTSYYFCLNLTDVEALDSAGATVAVTAGADNEILTSAFIGTIENKV